MGYTTNMTLAFYRKYRPKTFEDLLGQNEIREILQNAARQDKLAHAYLFYGGRGSGKTTAARLIAKITNCETRLKNEKFKLTGEPCNSCRPCQEIDDGRALDVIEIDAASNRGIDEIRDLKENIRLSPTSYNKKVFIIDEMHMLTREAFNALLKTLEEPPAHALFVLATTEYDKVPPTIASRTQRFHFKRLSISEIVVKLTYISKLEKIKIEQDALELIAAIAEGSLRDAESLLDQVTSMEENPSLDAIQKIVGRVGYKAITDFANLIFSTKGGSAFGGRNYLGAALSYANNLYNEGHNIVDFNKELINYFRRVLAIKFDPSLENLYKQELTKDQLAKIKEHSQSADVNITINLIKSLVRAYGEMRYSPLAIAPFEVAIIENLK